VTLLLRRRDNTAWQASSGTRRLTGIPRTNGAAAHFVSTSTPGALTSTPPSPPTFTCTPGALTSTGLLASTLLPDCLSQPTSATETKSANVMIEVFISVFTISLLIDGVEALWLHLYFPTTNSGV
jgi:hypothetical protein